MKTQLNNVVQFNAAMPAPAVHGIQYGYRFPKVKPVLVILLQPVKYDNINKPVRDQVEEVVAEVEVVEEPP